MAAKVLKFPWEFYPALTESKLNVIAEALLSVYDSTHSDLSTDLDDNYTRGTTTFGRSKNKLTTLARSGVYPWLDLRNTSNDLTCAIDGVPFRFFRDDHDKPTKKGFWRRNAQDDLFAVEDDQPVLFRFVLESPVSDVDEPVVYFLGFTATGQLACEWKHETIVRVLRSADDTRPVAEEIPSPTVNLKTLDAGAAQKDGTDK
jgi:hypothetical protein